MSENSARTEHAPNWWIAPVIVLASIALVAVSIGGWFALGRAIDAPVRAVHAEAQEDLQRIAVLSLVDEGRIDLDDTIDAYVRGASSELTVRDLLHATADHPGYIGLYSLHEEYDWSFGSSFDDEDLPSNAEAYALLERVIDAVRR